MSNDEIDRMDVARHLLPPPGDEVAEQLIAEVRRLRLTDAERVLVEKLTLEADHPNAGRPLFVTPADRATARGLLEKHNK